LVLPLIAMSLGAFTTMTFLTRNAFLDEIRKQYVMTAQAKGLGQRQVLDGLGLLSFESVINRDYPVVFATLYIFALLGLVVNLVSDFIYTLVDPRIDFESREV